MMHDYCEEALTHGEETIPVSMKGRNVTVILNPVANRRYVSLKMMATSKLDWLLTIF